MKAVILGAGYGTRLQKGLQELSPELRAQYAPLVEGKPKPLLPIASKPLINYLLEKIERETVIQDVYVVCNQFFHEQFAAWKKTLDSRLAVHVVNDGTLTNEDRFGVVKDLLHTMQQGNINDDLFILAGDTLYEMDFGNLVETFSVQGRSIIAVYQEDRVHLHKRGIVVTDAQGTILQFLEKPKDPPTTLAAPIAYVLARQDLNNLPRALGNGYTPELNTIEWLVGRCGCDIGTFRFSRRFDVGSIADYIAANDYFQRRLP